MTTDASTNKQRKIIHIDMDCFYAAVEIRDNPALTDKPVAVGGPAHGRGVVCTCNYVARKFGVHSAQAVAQAFRLCPDLVLLPVNMNKYRQVARQVHAIFREFTDKVEPLSLDEAYLDVSEVSHCKGSATLIAQEIRRRIKETVNLTASAGVASNKFLAKIASGWKKPDGLFVIHPDNVAGFIQDLPVKELYGVGKVTAEKLHTLGITRCADLQTYSLNYLVTRFGKMGAQLYNQCRGIDNREVEPNRIRKSLSVETTFDKDVNNFSTCVEVIVDLHAQLQRRIQESASGRHIKSQYIKMKFSDFKIKTAEVASDQTNLESYKSLLHDSYMRGNKSVRLLGVGVHFNCEDVNKAANAKYLQQSMF